MKVKTIIASVALAGALATPAQAHAAYFIGQGQAGRDVMQAAETKYEADGVTADEWACWPQGQRATPDFVPDRYHRWTCAWTGTDGDGDGVYGQFRITGHTGNQFGYLAVRGGLKWF